MCIVSFRAHISSVLDIQHHFLIRKQILKKNCRNYCVAGKIRKPTSSEVLSCYLRQCNEPPWTSYFVKYSSVKDDQWGLSHFNWYVGASNYHILRTGCFPYIKYHCSRRPYEDLTIENNFFRVIKVINIGIPCLAYGLAATMLIKHKEVVSTSQGFVHIYFLYKEDKGSLY